MFNGLLLNSLVINLRGLKYTTKIYFYSFVIMLIVFCLLCVEEKLIFFPLQILFTYMLKIPETTFRLPDNFHSYSHSMHYMSNFLNYFFIIYLFWCLKCLTFSLFCATFFCLEFHLAFSQSIFHVEDMSFSSNISSFYSPNIGWYIMLLW